jgi:hypothetical protein
LNSGVFDSAISDRRRLTVIANGPSAKTVDLRYLTRETNTLAVNGSLKLFLDQGVSPTYWVACDPQELVADFLPDNPPEYTQYFIASKCHPRVFDKLRGLDVLLWHLNDHPVSGRWNIPPSSSVTICAAWLMNRLGYTDFDFYGWDGCYINGYHHASEDSKKTPELEITYGGKVEGDNVTGGKTFMTNTTWAAEVQGAEQFFQLAKYFDINLTIHGDGMFAYAKKFLEGNENG